VEVGAILRVLWFGVGTFGSQMASRLLSSSCQIYLPNISHGRKASEILVTEGAEWYSDTEVDAYCFCLPRSEDVAECINRSAPKAPVQMFDFSTGDPLRAGDLAAQASESGSLYFDCPVSGSAVQAAAGMLTMWIGSAEHKATALCHEVVNKLSSRRFWMGACGAGFSAKLVNQVVHILNVAAIGEGLKVADALELPRELIIESLKSSSAASAMLDRFGSAIAAGDHSTQFRLELAANDIDYVIEALSPRIRDGLPYLRDLKQDLNKAISRGLQDKNFTCFVDGDDRVRD
jgi:3-hydroxyisobutyrate dehydrogenase-like beta-hydroxyacid dehydrogenase